MKVLVTGAHFTVAWAVIEELKKYPEVDLVYVGRNSTMEGDLARSAESVVLPKLGVKFISLTTGRLQRSLSVYTIFSILKIPWGFLQSAWILLREKPCVVLSFGGYVAVPVVLVSWLFSIPVIIHEQTLVAGLANRISAFFANIIAVSFPIEYPYQREKIIITGNPIRSEIQDAESIKRAGKPIILITGGNQGSHVINLAVEECLDELLKICKIIHQTGDSKFRDFERLKTRQSDQYRVEKFIDEEWGKILGSVDLVVTRAGMNILTELKFLAKPALLIPIPFMKEQNINARYFKKTGLVTILPQSKLSGRELLKSIKEMLADIKNFKLTEGFAGDTREKNAAERVAYETINLVN